MQPPIGIDLGTTNSLIATFADGQPKLIPNALGDYLTPSVVSVENGKVLVGRPARDRLLTHRDNTAAVFKRRMGTEAKIRLGGKDFTPAELSSIVLSKLRADAEAYLGTAIRDVVVSVPAYFNQAQRKATQEACALAGLNLLRLVNEPTAAALAYGVHQRDAETQFLIFDLGGGTFDVTILEMFDGVMEVKASSGDAFLGGEDFTEVLAKLICLKLDKPWAKLSSEMQTEIRLRADIVKMRLSSADTCVVTFSEEAGIHEVSVSRNEFEEAVKPIIRRMAVPIERCMYDTALESSGLDRILLVGGATRMPIIRQMVTKYFSKFPEFQIDPDHAVALGAAVQAALIAEDRALEDIVLTDVSPFSVGIETAQQMPNGKMAVGLFSPIIERNTPLPASRVEYFHPVSDNQRQVEISVYQGEAAHIDENVLLGTYTVKLPAKRESQESLEVLLTYDTSGLLEVETTVESSGRKERLVIETLAETLTKNELSKRLKKMAELKTHPRENEVNQALTSRLNRIFQMVKGEQRQDIREMIALFDATLAGRDQREIDRVRGEIEVVLKQIDDFYVS